MLPQHRSMLWYNIALLHGATQTDPITVDTVHEDSSQFIHVHLLCVLTFNKEIDWGGGSVVSIWFPSPMLTHSLLYLQC